MIRTYPFSYEAPYQKKTLHLEDEKGSFTYDASIQANCYGLLNGKYQLVGYYFTFNISFSNLPLDCPSVWELYRHVFKEVLDLELREEYFEDHGNHIQICNLQKERRLKKQQEGLLLSDLESEVPCISPIKLQPHPVLFREIVGKGLMKYQIRRKVSGVISIDSCGRGCCRKSFDRRRTEENYYFLEEGLQKFNITDDVKDLHAIISWFPHLDRFISINRSHDLEAYRQYLNRNQDGDEKEPYRSLKNCGRRPNVNLGKRASMDRDRFNALSLPQQINFYENNSRYGYWITRAMLEEYGKMVEGLVIPYLSEVWQTEEKTVVKLMTGWI